MSSNPDGVELEIQVCAGITCGRVLNRELIAQRLHKLISLHLFTDCYMKISVQLWITNLVVTQAFPCLI